MSICSLPWEEIKTLSIRALLGASAVCALSTAAFAETITAATVNNGDMIRMQGLMSEFNAKYPDIQVEWVTLEENALRQQVTTDIATQGGQYDVLTIGTYEVPIWGKQGWLESLDGLPAEWDADDILPAIRAGLTVDGTLYAAPFYGESSMVMYRKDLMDAAGLTMPDAPTWADIKAAAAAMTDKSKEQYGVCLRGKAGWGENMAFLTAMSNSYSAKWFDENWKPQFDGEAWKTTLTDYLDLMNNYGPPGASSNGFNENLTLFQQGKCGMWIDATVAASFVTNPKDSTVLASAATASGHGRLRSLPPRTPRTRQRPSSPGQRRKSTPRSSPRKRVGPTFRREPAPRFTRMRNTRLCPLPR
jgi:sorbitol/mannitol transport system substrate-binding protein